MSLVALQGLLIHYNIDGYIIPSWDEFQNEYPLEARSYLRYLTSFSGSYGIAIIMRDISILFTDSRYTLQAANEVDHNIEVRDINDLPQWTKDNSTLVLGYSAELFTKRQLSLFKEQRLEDIPSKLLQDIWPNRPGHISNTPFIYPEEYSGSTYSERLEKIQRAMQDHGADYLISTAPECVCWLLGLRGTDQPYVLTFAARMVISCDRVMVFSDVELDVERLCTKYNVQALPLEQFDSELVSLRGKVIYDERSCSSKIYDMLANCQIISKIDPIYLIKACKTKNEIANFSNIHIQDAVAVCEFFAWLEGQVQNGVAVTEYEAGLTLSSFRAQREGYICDSFAPICGFASNGAIVHYRAERESSKIIDDSSLLLVDSGGHYYGGTTDVTRSVCFGKPSCEQKQRYTDVLKGHILFSILTFPNDVSVSNLDAVNRQYLWEHGLDYGHGTGHGVGNVLSVHESPPSMHYKAKRQTLYEGMVLSNEPGFYKEGAWGMRVENLIYVAASQHDSFLQFEQLTMIPYAPNLIDWERIFDREMIYLKNYYTKIKQLIIPHLSDTAKNWCLRSLYLPE